MGEGTRSTAVLLLYAAISLYPFLWMVSAAFKDQLAGHPRRGRRRARRPHRPVQWHTVVNVAAPDTTATVPTTRLLTEYLPETEVVEALKGFAVPVSTRVCRELLGFTPVHPWRTA